VSVDRSGGSPEIPKNVFAEQLGMKASHFSELPHGKRHVGGVTALKQENLLGIPAEYWMRIQVYHDLLVERHKQEVAWITWFLG
jgi:antitoxin HigA-1